MKVELTSQHAHSHHRHDTTHANPRPADATSTSEHGTPGHSGRYGVMQGCASTFRGVFERVEVAGPCRGQCFTEPNLTERSTRTLPSMGAGGAWECECVCDTLSATYHNHSYTHGSGCGKITTHASAACGLAANFECEDSGATDTRWMALGQDLVRRTCIRHVGCMECIHARPNARD